MRFRFGRWAMAATVMVAVGMVSGSAKSAERADASVHAPSSSQKRVLQGPKESKRYVLHLHHLHTGEDLDVVYRVGDTYIPAALDKLNYFLRDHRTKDEKSYDPKEFDLLHALMAKLGRPNGVIDIVCGYRTPWSNHYLRTRSANTGVAEHSQHMLAKAIDIRVPGVSTLKLRNTALSLHEGGVGYYPVSQFVHVDVGPVRHWSFGASRSRARMRVAGD